MSLPRHRSRALAATAAGTLILLTGCGTETAPTSGPEHEEKVTENTTSAAPEPTDTATETPTETPTTEPSTSEPSVTATDEPSTSNSGAALRQRLLPADQLPGVNDRTTWSVASTQPERGAVNGSCQRFSLVDTGADSAVLREYDGGEGVRATQVVAEFADQMSALRASRVLTTWGQKCAEHLDAGVEKVGPVNPVPVEDGEGSSQLVQYGAVDAELHTFAGIALVQRGRFLSFVEIAVDSSDYNYEPGQEPATLAVPLVAERLGQ